MNLDYANKDEIICVYCSGNCPNEPENSKFLCDYFAGDVESFYASKENIEKGKKHNDFNT